MNAAPRTALMEAGTPDMASIGSVRRWATATAVAWGLERLIEPLQLVLSELVANAFEHAGTACTIRLDHQPGCLRIEVRDGSGAMPVVRELGVGGAGGRGLLIVRALSQGFGSAPTDTGKLVWCELTDDAGASTPSP